MNKEQRAAALRLADWLDGFGAPTTIDAADLLRALAAEPEPEVVATYNGDAGRREWVAINEWLHPGERIAILRDTPQPEVLKGPLPEVLKRPLSMDGKFDPVAWQWINTAHFRRKIPANANPGDWRPLYTHPPQADALREELERKSDAIQRLWRERDELRAENAALREAAQAVVDRWDTPNWKDAPATAEVIGRLRAELEKGHE